MDFSPLHLYIFFLYPVLPSGSSVRFRIRLPSGSSVRFRIRLPRPVLLSAEASGHILPVLLGISQKPLGLLHGHIREIEEQTVGTIFLHDPVRISDPVLKFAAVYLDPQGFSGPPGLIVDHVPLLLGSVRAMVPRSEERRVGKECL